MATKSELDQEVEDLRDVLNATLEDKAALASQCSALEAQVCFALCWEVALVSYAPGYLQPTPRCIYVGAHG